MSDERVRAIFNRAILTSNGAKLRSVLSDKELNGATAKACTDFLQAVTMPEIRKIITTGKGFNHYVRLGNKDCPVSYQFLPNGRTKINLGYKQPYSFEPIVIQSNGRSKSGTGFADLAAWAANQEAVFARKQPIPRPQFAHNMLKNWIPKFLAFGIKGSVEAKSQTYLTWYQILAKSQQELDEGKKKSL